MSDKIGPPPCCTRNQILIGWSWAQLGASKTSRRYRRASLSVDVLRVAQSHPKHQRADVTTASRHVVVAGHCCVQQADCSHAVGDHGDDHMRFAVHPQCAATLLACMDAHISLRRCKRLRRDVRGRVCSFQRIRPSYSIVCVYRRSCILAAAYQWALAKRSHIGICCS